MNGGRAFGRALAAAAVLAVGGCAWTPAVLDPKGPVGLAERDLLFAATGLMLIVVIPVFVMAFWFAWHFRASNVNARYAPHWNYSGPIDAVVWLVPALIVVAIGYLVWNSTHRLDPYRPIAATTPPLQVDVVAEDWRWLFLYPEQNIAVVNELVFPSGRPLSLRLTSDTVMNSFYIPGLGGQIFAMAGMQTRLHLLADGPATFVGRNMQYSGRGFPDQSFAVHAVGDADFRSWIAQAKQAPGRLDAAGYAVLAKPTAKSPVIVYSAYEPGLFERIIDRYMGPAGRPRRQLARRQLATTALPQAGGR